MSTYRAQQPFKGMTMAQMKKKWQSMTPKERSQNVQSFRDAAKKAPKASKPTPKPKAAAKKPVVKPKQKSDGSVTATRSKTKYERDQAALTEQLMTPKQRKEYLKLRGAAVKRNRR
tara:strand:- start:3836 stop:4183 length:348 start_codon:yes stop_codon:yes gene_type:complete